MPKESSGSLIFNDINFDPIGPVLCTIQSNYEFCIPLRLMSTLCCRYDETWKNVTHEEGCNNIDKFNYYIYDVFVVLLEYKLYNMNIKIPNIASIKVFKTETECFFKKREALRKCWICFTYYFAAQASIYLLLKYYFHTLTMSIH